MVASSGLLLVAVAQLLGSALTTEFVFGVQDPDLLVPETAVFFGHWIGTIPWLWGGAGLDRRRPRAAPRHGAYPRWIGWLGCVLGGLMLLMRISPLQYMAGMVGPAVADRHRDRPAGVAAGRAEHADDARPTGRARPRLRRLRRPASPRPAAGGRGHHR